MKERFTPKRVICNILGMFLLALGIAASVRSNLGSSPVASLPYMLNLVAGIEFGTATTLCMCLYVLVQFLILRRDFKLSMLLQLVVSFVFGYMNTVAVWIVNIFPAPQGIVMRLFCTCLGFVVGGFGVWVYNSANVIRMPTEALVAVVADKLGKPFHIIKIYFDVTNVVLAGGFCLIFIHSLGSVGIGTVIIAIMMGTMMGIYTRWWGKPLKAWVDKDKPIIKSK